MMISRSPRTVIADESSNPFPRKYSSQFHFNRHYTLVGQSMDIGKMEKNGIFAKNTQNLYIWHFNLH